ncbi:MAG: HD-GYP domain-containing protein, partial [Solirubrobacteraceae bacterium]
MFRPGAGEFGWAGWRDVLAPLAAAVSVVICVVAVVLSAPDRVDALSAILGVGAIGAGILVAGESGRLAISAAFTVYVLAAALLGPISAIAAAVIAEIAATVVMRTRWRTFVYNNLPSAAVPALVAAVIIRSLTTGPVPRDDFAFYLAVAVAGAVALVLNFAIFAGLRRVVIPELPQYGWRTFLEFVPSGALSLLVVLAGVGITLKVGNAGIAFALAGVFAFSYMTHLLERSRQRAEQYVALSWGVLAGLMRSLDIRDERAARHSAAVARFARDIAKAVGMSEAESELAHTAGLLHDIGRFALSDRVAERGRTLTDDDWMAIQRHPELGADMLRDLGMYGPVAEIVIAHHERIDGRGYPAGLTEEEIPEIAKIISVAEVYDTLTASDTYRTQMSSFEALTELRRVAGTQVDSRYVEVLASLLSGEGVEYRHADTADF